jgi:hypothetical protein
MHGMILLALLEKQGLPLRPSGRIFCRAAEDPPGPAGVLGPRVMACPCNPDVEQCRCIACDSTRREAR